MAINRRPSPVLLYLYSRKNIAGSLLALLGLGLFFVGFIGTLWVVVVPALYLIGALVVPNQRRIDLAGGVDPEDVRNALNHQVSAVRGKLPDEAYRKVIEIQQILLGILPRIDRLAPGSQDRYIVQKSATDYLPGTLQAYLDLPRAYAAIQRLPDGRTAAQALLDQLNLLESKLNEVADAVNKNDTDKLLANGRFLQERFGGGGLTVS